MVLTKEKIISTLEEHSDGIKSCGVIKIELFGSYTQGKQKDESDIDFLVKFEKGRGLFDDYSNLYNLLQKLFEKNIDIVESELVREKLKPYILGGERIAATL